MRNVILIFTLFLLVLLANCCEIPICQNPPLFIDIKIVKKNTHIDLLANKSYNQDSIQVYYLNNNQKIKVKIDFSKDSLGTSFILYSNDWIGHSEKGIKDYYIQFDNFDTDTLYLDATITKPKDGCGEYEHIEKFKHNGVEIPQEFGDFFYIQK